MLCTNCGKLTTCLFSIRQRPFYSLKPLKISVECFQFGSVAVIQFIFVYTLQPFNYCFVLLIVFAALKYSHAALMEGRIFLKK